MRHGNVPSTKCRWGRPVGNTNTPSIIDQNNRNCPLNVCAANANNKQQISPPGQVTVINNTTITITNANGGGTIINHHTQTYKQPPTGTVTNQSNKSNCGIRERRSGCEPRLRPWCKSKPRVCRQSSTILLYNSPEFSHQQRNAERKSPTITKGSSTIHHGMGTKMHKR